MCGGCGVVSQIALQEVVVVVVEVEVEMMRADDPRLQRWKCREVNVETMHQHHHHCW